MINAIINLFIGILKGKSPNVCKMGVFAAVQHLITLLSGTSCLTSCVSMNLWDQYQVSGIVQAAVQNLTQSSLSKQENEQMNWM